MMDPSWISLIGTVLNTLVAIFTWWKAESARAQSAETGHVVNSRIDEFKELLAKNSQETVEKFKDDLREAALKAAEATRGHGV